MNKEKLTKILAGSGLGSRRKTDEMIKSGKVKVNHIIVLDPWHKVIPDIDIITIDNIKINNNNKKIYIALNKPIKFLSDMNFKDDRKLARDLIEIDTYLFPVGRLDYESEGLMIFTNDGSFAQKVLHPKYGVEKEYIVKMKGVLNENEKKKIKRGLKIDGELLKVEEITKIKNTLNNSWYKVTLKEGKNRMIRKIGDYIEHKVLKLIRTKIGNITLGRLKPGEYRFIKKNEIKEILIN